MLAAWLLGTRSIIQMRGSYRVRGTLSVAGQTWGETRGQLTQLILALWSPAVPAPAWAELRPSIACSSFPSALSLLCNISTVKSQPSQTGRMITLTDFACIALLCRNQRTPVDIAPTRKDARAIATATSTGTSTRVWLVWLLYFSLPSWLGTEISALGGFWATVRWMGPLTVICCRLDSLWGDSLSAQVLGSTHSWMLPLAPALVAEQRPIRHWIQILSLKLATSSLI